MRWIRHIGLAVMFLVASWAVTSPATAQCVQVALIDDAGKIVTPGGLVIGFKIGESIVYNVGLPPHREQKEARAVPCPQDLITEINDLFNRSCTSERARVQTAVTNNTSVDAVVQRCVDMRDAMMSRD